MRPRGATSRSRGLGANIVCALILGKVRYDANHSIEHDHNHDSGHYHDLNLKSAYVHVAADAATSVLAIVALVGGWAYGWAWLDPVMGIVGAIRVSPIFTSGVSASAPTRAPVVW